MSRSRRRPYWSIAGSVKPWKRMWHHTMRAKVKVQMHHDPESVSVIVDKNEYSDVYDSPRDGSAQYVPEDIRTSLFGEEAWRLERK